MLTTHTESRLAQITERLSSLSGSFYFYEPRERMRGSGSGSPLVWEPVSPNEESRLSYGELSDYSGALCRTLGGGISRLSPEEAIAELCRARAWQSASLLFVPSNCESGDYGGSTYQLSNAEALLKEFGGSPGCRELIGGYGSYGLAIDPRYASDELVEALESLESYPVWDEEHLSEVEERLKEEAFSCWLSSDLRRLIAQVLEEHLRDHDYEEEEADEISERISEEATEESLWELLSSSDQDGCLWRAEHNAMWCDLDRVETDLILSTYLTEEALS